jgi:hypothetical protein
MSYFKVQQIVNVPCLSVCGLHGDESIILSAGSAESIILSAGSTESMMLSSCAESMIVSAPPASSMSSGSIGKKLYLGKSKWWEISIFCPAVVAKNYLNSSPGFTLEVLQKEAPFFSL